jgi:hypothetical protein
MMTESSLDALDESHLLVLTTNPPCSSIHDEDNALTTSPNDDSGNHDLNIFISELNNNNVKSHNRSWMKKRCKIRRALELMDERSSLGRSVWLHLPDVLKSDPEITLIAWTRNFTDDPQHRPSCLDTDYLHAA